MYIVVLHTLRDIPSQRHFTTTSVAGGVFVFQPAGARARKNGGLHVSRAQSERVKWRRVARRSNTQYPALLSTWDGKGAPAFHTLKLFMKMPHPSSK